ncbi:MAG: hypothetical protein V4632_03515 [Pseudomonadota bacterium]
MPDQTARIHLGRSGLSGRIDARKTVLANAGAACGTSADAVVDCTVIMPNALAKQNVQSISTWIGASADVLSAALILC